MERCPICKARLRGKTICNRCEADLGQLQTIESRAKQLAAKAIHNLLAGDMRTAGTHATAARALHSTPFHHVLSKFIETMVDEESVRRHQM